MVHSRRDGHPARRPHPNAAGSGTGFLFHRSKSGRIAAIATAAHVIDQCHQWGEPIRIHHAPSGDPALLREADRALFVDSQRDTAAIVMSVGKLSFPPELLELTPPEKYVKVGNDIGWLGYPAIPRADLCFFSGRISAWVQDELAYLVDGVAINGVSGGPAFFFSTGTPETPTLMGVLSAYIPNRATGEVLPGLAVVRHVSHFHELIKDFKSVEEAKQEETLPAEPPAGPPGDEPRPGTPTKRPAP